MDGQTYRQGLKFNAPPLCQGIKNSIKQQTD